MQSRRIMPGNMFARSEDVRRHKYAGVALPSVSGASLRNHATPALVCLGRTRRRRTLGCPWCRVSELQRILPGAFRQRVLHPVLWLQLSGSVFSLCPRSGRVLMLTVLLPSVACGIAATGYTAAMNQLSFGAAPGDGAGDACGRCFRLTGSADPYSPSYTGP